MSDINAADSGTLGWVKSEINETLDRAREAIADFATDASDLTPLRIYANHLHQVVGTLKMVELDGAAMLAIEAESLADVMLHDGRECDVEKATSLLGASLEGLSTYLDKLQRGMVDIPVNNLQLMNDLRDLRGESPVEIFSLFNPDIEVYPPEALRQEKLDDGQYRERVTRIRRDFQVALLEWLRDQDISGLLRIGDLTRELQGIARFRTVSQLWWVAGAYMEMLVVGEPEHGSVQKQIPARLDQVLRRLIDGGEAAIVKERSKNLIRQMLYDIGTSSSDSSLVKEIRREFKLDPMLRGEADAKSGSAAKLPADLVTVLQAEMNKIKDALTNYFEHEQRDPAQIDNVVQDLGNIAERIRQADAPGLKELVTEIINVLRLVARGQDQQNDEQSVALQIAEALLFLEKSLGYDYEADADSVQTLADMVQRLRDLQQYEQVDEDSHTSHAVYSPSDPKRLLSAVAEEIYINLKAAEESLESFAEQSEPPTVLEDVPDKLEQVQGALRMLGQYKAADMLSTANGYFKKLADNEIEATAVLIDSLAVAIGTAQTFVDGVDNDRPYVHEMVDRAIQDLEDILTEQELANFDPAATVAALHEHLESWLTDNANYTAFRQLRHRLREISAVASVRNRPKPRRIAQEMNNLLDIVTEDPSFLSQEVERTLHRSLRTLEELVAEIGDVGQTAEDPTPGVVRVHPSFEPEIREIFREEARECIDNIEQLFDIWQQDTTNESVLIDLRRQFHTLKGSGRTANAGPFAELAWIVENLLNLVLDHKLDVSESLLSFVADAKRTIVDVLGDEALGARSLNLETWQQRSGAILQVVEGGVAVDDRTTDVAAAEPGDAAAEQQSTFTASVPETAAGGEIDDIVVRIFTQETLGHISTIRSFIGNKSTTVTPELLRAVHTLRGSSRSLHLVEMSNVFHVLDEHLSTIDMSADQLGQTELELLDRAAILSATMLDRLNRDRTFPATLREEFDRLQAGIVALKQRRFEEKQLEDSPVELGDMGLLGTLIAEDAGTANRVEATTDEIPDQDTREDSDEDLADLREVFCAEAADALARINRNLDQWSNGEEQDNIIPEIRRDLHTLKGSARAIGVDAIGNIGHETETLLQRTENGLSIKTDDLRSVLEEAHDTLSHMVNALKQGQELEDAADLERRILELGEAALREQAEIEPDQSRQETDAVPVGVTPVPLPLQIASNATTQQNAVVDRDRASVDAGRDVLRVETQVLDKLVNYAGEVSITRAQMQEQLSGLRSNLTDLRVNVSRFSDQLRELDVQADSQIPARLHESSYDPEQEHKEFDPLELDRYTKLQHLSRGLSESLDGLVMIQSGLGRFVHQSESVLQQQAQLSSELQDGLMSTRLVPFSTLTPRLRHQVRQTARELRKESELTVVGGDVEVDRKVLDGVSEALDHMIRNALGHGIEDPAEREAQGKPRTGTIRIECKQQGNQAVIRFSDDGAGLDMDKIGATAVSQGLLREQAPLTDQEIIQLIVLPGFTTASAVSKLSGRGVGMDVVHNSVRRLGGRITVDSEAAKGTTFTIGLPLSLSITQALFVRCGEQEFGISLNLIHNVMSVDPNTLVSPSTEAQPLFEHNGQVYPLIDLPQKLNLGSGEKARKKVPIMIVRMGARDVAVKVSELLGTQEVVVKPFGSHISRLEGMAGATVRGDGSVVIILDLAELWLADERDGVTDISTLIKVHNPPLIMVIDDSLTVRKVTARNLSRHGMDVLVAKDGLDALDKMGKKLPDLMLVDIEMPRMDGYELTERIRADAATRDIPIVIITSRAGTKHKEKAMALGANGYLTKPYQEEELISNVEACLSQAGRKVSIQ